MPKDKDLAGFQPQPPPDPTRPDEDVIRLDEAIQAAGRVCILVLRGREGRPALERALVVLEEAMLVYREGADGGHDQGDDGPLGQISG